MSSVDKPEVQASPRSRRKRGVPEGLWMRCEGCGATVFKKKVEEHMGVCTEAGCNYHFYVAAMKRIEQLLDQDSFEEWHTELSSLDPLGFVDRRPYPERLREEQARTGLKEA